MQFLTVTEICVINRMICNKARHNSNIEYVTLSPTRIDKLSVLVDTTPTDETCIDIATYYMKYIILLQCFSDGNHRTALESVRLFFHKNNIDFKWNPKYVVKYQQDIYRLRYKIYNTYEELSTYILNEPHNKLWKYCRNCIDINLSE